MNGAPSPTQAVTNTATNGAVVGIQGEHVHNATVYQVLPDAPPSEKYTVGMRYLDDGVPTKARELIHDAIAHGHDSAEVRFHSVLALLSKRSYRDLSREERKQLEELAGQLGSYGDSEWKRALQAISELVDCFNGGTGNPGLAIQQLRSLPPYQRDNVFRHLDLVLTGSMKDAVWADTREAAAGEQHERGRQDRVWAYFYPDPVLPRPRERFAPILSLGERVRVTTATGVLAAVVVYLGWLVLVLGELLPLAAYVLAVASGYLATRSGFEWYYRSSRLFALERAHTGRPRQEEAPLEEGFEKQVDHSFSHYFALYVPKNIDREAWRTKTSGIRRILRNEVVELYRDQRVKLNEVSWLIRRLVQDTGTRWTNRSLFAYRKQHQTPTETIIQCVLSVATFAAATITAGLYALQRSPLTAVVVILLLIACIYESSTQWVRIVYEKRRYSEELAENEQKREVREDAYGKWKHKLLSTRPSERHMERWLECDKTLLLDYALKHYRLAWREIIAHTFLQAPGQGSLRAREKNGPWRYSKYDIRLFLVTHDGVREVTAHVDFKKAEHNCEERNNFRFDAVSSVHVSITEDFRYTLQLTLTNGPTRDIIITEPEVSKNDTSENLLAFSRVNRDASGFSHTLHILEGIAAEGKKWISRDSLTTAAPHPLQSKPEEPEILEPSNK